MDIDWGLMLRALMGLTALLVAGSQVVMRIAWWGHTRISRKEISGATSILLTFTGIAVGQLLFLHAKVTASTILLSLGVLAGVWGVYEIYVVIQRDATDREASP